MLACRRAWRRPKTPLLGNTSKRVHNGNKTLVQTFIGSVIKCRLHAVRHAVEEGSQAGER